ncbi:hypothetical protein GCM10012275_63270 [Longimycelium tulufanense]|uniref:Uncharacterized protein n=1 Tax=Longimycelium tulufanense TaxID=907463 RepID=A0A8J3FY03_9PSEU|nr:hypothetical protein [Longimycelium tulufanense]GGM83997.1 hypothetical protein GCM10012275_63270 [Longimycelium tulufanense]
MFTAKAPREVVEELADWWADSAYHEGGHCVAAVQLGLTVTEVVMGYRRETKWFGPDHWGVSGRTGIRHGDKATDAVSAVIAAAGPVAEAVWQHRSQGLPLRRSIRTYLEQEKADLALLDRHRRAAHLSRDRVVDQARDVVQRHWRRIEHIAAELIDHGRLTGRRVHRLAH